MNERICHPERSEGPGRWLARKAALPPGPRATLGMTLLLAACTTAPPPPAPKPTVKEVPAAALQDVAGESTEAAVIVPADAPNEGVDFENQWIFSRYGRFRRSGGGTGSLSNRRYDVVEVELANGDTKKIYFDITENWAKWNPPAH
jgi:hypothetical protein